MSTYLKDHDQWKKKLSAKYFLGSIFANGGHYTMEQLLNGGAYKEATIRTAITDLKNPKYSAGPLLFIDNDGTHFFTNVDSPAEAVDESSKGDEEVSLVDQVPENMPIAKGLVSWIEDGAGLLFGAFNASFDINDAQDKLTASIQLDGTPSTFTEGGRRLSIDPGENEATVAVEMEGDGRSVRLFVEAIEHGFCHAFCYPMIEVETSKLQEALELANYINQRSKLAHIYWVSGDDKLIPCIKASSVLSVGLSPFEKTCYAVLEVTYRYWDDFCEL